jgi:hypothetical protein
MDGDDRVRFCDECELNVYNLVSMTEAEALELIAESEGRPCVRMYQREDGTVITRDCPVGMEEREGVVSLGGLEPPIRVNDFETLGFRV